MSSRPPMWYCHECHAEMRPLMVPDPHCASCNGTFVEKMENPADDPREFSGAAGDFNDPFSGGGEGDNMFFNLLRAMSPPQANRSTSSPVGSSTTPGGGGGSGFTLRIDRTSTPGGGARTTFTSRPVQSTRTGDIPTLSDYVQRNSTPGSRPEGNTINGSLMFQYLLAMLQQPGRQGQDQFGNLFGGMMPPGAENGRMGDYVFNQEALDQIITQIMENSSAHPVAATEEIIDKLPREVLEEGSPLLEKDCAVCKDQFSLTTEDPDEQVIVTLPCKHPFHEPCIIPWLKSSGTCPVCRYQLVPQPDHHSPGPGGSNGPDANNRRRSGSGGGSGGSPGSPTAVPGGIFGNLFQLFGGSYGNDSSSSTSGNNNHSTSSSNTTGNNQPSTSGTTNNNNSSNSNSSQFQQRSSREHVPGGWDDMEVD